MREDESEAAKRSTSAKPTRPVANKPAEAAGEAMPSLDGASESTELADGVKPARARRPSAQTPELAPQLDPNGPFLSFGTKLVLLVAVIALSTLFLWKYFGQPTAPALIETLGGMSKEEKLPEKVGYLNELVIVGDIGVEITDVQTATADQRTTCLWPSSAILATTAAASPSASPRRR